MHLHDPTRRHPNIRRADLPLGDVEEYVASFGDKVVYAIACPIGGLWQQWNRRNDDG
ncbi:hypothetical protein [Sinorhizobium medicae]|uniref:hypothetical protein n=1 Tax=Sinorhizobium medicae TaxID=110321 RepID=UPI0013E3BECC|nr:hypothetical protein [Sinorhizobium medicae]